MSLGPITILIIIHTTKLVVSLQTTNPLAAEIASLPPFLMIYRLYIYYPPPKKSNNNIPNRCFRLHNPLGPSNIPLTTLP